MVSDSWTQALNDLPICRPINVLDGSLALVHPLTADITRVGSLYEEIVCSTAGGALNAGVNVTVACVAMPPFELDLHATAVLGIVTVSAWILSPLANVLAPGTKAT
jgi:hypothetical protein